MWFGMNLLLLVIVGGSVWSQMITRFVFVVIVGLGEVVG